MPDIQQEAGKYLNGSTSQLVKTGAGVCVGVVVASSTTGTIKLWDSLTAANSVIVDTTAAITAPAYIKIGAKFQTGLFITVGGTINYTVIYE